ncbi:MAG: hypothetical protein J0L88_02615 [Xanthomonadales bacterium]|nr:hypothetical protein [Xanthomonadales bacterium]
MPSSWSRVCFALLGATASAGAIAGGTFGDSGWSHDPAQNLVVADRAGEETQAKILARADGGFYVSWFDNTDGGYSLRLQRLDANGVEQWAHNGIVVAARSYSSTTDYGLAVDGQGHALLSFQCCVQGAGDERIVVARIAPDGSAVWSGVGVAVSTPGEGAVVSQVTAASDGDAVVIWMNNAGAGRAQKLDPAGSPRWGATGVSLPGPAAGLKFIADVKPSTNGDAIVSWSNQQGSTRILRAQKLGAADGAAMWGSDGVRVADAGNLQAGYFPKMLVDGSGGVVFGYYDASGVSWNVRVQRLDAAGTRLYGDNGVLASTDTTRGHYSPAVSFNPANGDTHIVWVDGQTINQQAYDGLYAQRIDASGARRYGDEGRVIVPMTQSTDGAQSLSQLVALSVPDGFIAAWVTGNTSVTNQRISTLRLDNTGAFAWPAPVPLKTAPTATSRLAGANSTLGYAAFAWGDGIGNDTATRDIHAQDLPWNGVFDDTLFADGFDD